MTKKINKQTKNNRHYKEAFLCVKNVAVAKKTV